MIKNQWYPIRARLPTTLAVNTSSEQLCHNTQHCGQHDQTQNGQAIGEVVVEDQFHARRHVGGHVQHEQGHQQRRHYRMSAGHLVKNTVLNTVSEIFGK